VERLTRRWYARSPGGASPVTGRQADAIGNCAVEGVNEAIFNRASVVTRPLPPSVARSRPAIGAFRLDDRRLYAAVDTSCFEPALPGSTGMGSILRPIRGPEPALAVIRNNRLDVSSVGFGFVAVPF
jgi:hypothetical protein